jgi:hypothetical protein
MTRSERLNCVRGLSAVVSLASVTHARPLTWPSPSAKRERERKRERENQELLHDNTAGTLSPAQQGSAKQSLGCIQQRCQMVMAAAAMEREPGEKRVRPL